MSTLHTYNLIVCILRDVESLINVTHNPLDIVCQCYIFFFTEETKPRQTLTQIKMSLCESLLRQKKLCTTIMRRIIVSSKHLTVAGGTQRWFH